MVVKKKNRLLKTSNKKRLKDKKKKIDKVKRKLKEKKIVNNRNVKLKTLKKPKKVRRPKKRPPFVRYFNDDLFDCDSSWLYTVQHPAPLNVEDSKYLVYQVTPENRRYRTIYVGSTPDFPRRMQQHNGVKAMGGKACKKWVQTWRTQAEPINVVTGFKSKHDALCFEKFVQKLKVSKFASIDPGPQKKDESGQVLQKYIRKLMIALNYQRWKDYPLQLVWYDKKYRPINPEYGSILIERFEKPLKFVKK